MSDASTSDPQGRRHVSGLGADESRSVTPCLVSPPKALLDSMPLLTLIAVAVEAGDAAAVQSAVLDVDLDACRDYWASCAAEARRRYRPVDRPQPARVKGGVTERIRIRLGGRDGWRCRYCTIPLTWTGFFAPLWDAEGFATGNDVNDLWREAPRVW